MTLTLHYPLSETEGTTAYDYTGNALDGDVVGAGPAGTGTFPGIFGQTAYAFDGQSDYIRVDPRVDAFDGGYTVAAWVRAPTGLGSTETQTLAAFDGEAAVALDLSDGDYRFRETDPNGTVHAATEAARLGEYVHVAGVKHPGHGLFLYVDAVEVDHATFTGSARTDTLTETRVGSTGDGTAFYAGRLADLRVYARPLTPGAVLELVHRPHRGRVEFPAHTPGET